MRAFGNVVVAAVASTVVSRSIIGNRFAFQVPAYSPNGPKEIVLYMALGLAAGLVGIMFIRMLNAAEDILTAGSFPNC